jgi:hypothetical protein
MTKAGDLSHEKNNAVVLRIMISQARRLRKKIVGILAIV